MNSQTMLIRGFSLSVILSAIALSVGWGQSAGPYDLEWSSVDSGSGQAQGDNYRVDHTAGQPDVLLLQNAQYQLYSGFWGIAAQGGTETPTPTPMVTPTGTSPGTAIPTPTSTTTLGPSATPSNTPSSSVTATPTCSARYDLSGEGDIDYLDLLMLVDDLKKNGFQGDFNCDGKTDYQDLLLFSKEWQK